MAAPPIQVTPPHALFPPLTGGVCRAASEDPCVRERGPGCHCDVPI